MQIRIHWVDKNSVAVRTNIARSEAPIDTENLPAAPYGSVGAGISEFLDTNTVPGHTYYYVLEQYVGAQTSVSKNFKIVATPRSGLGPQELSVGDSCYGYYGTLTSADFISGSELIEKVGLSNVGVVNNPTPKWGKFSHNGETVFVPTAAIVKNISWKDLYDKGLVYGTNDNGLVPTDTPTNQMTVIEHLGEYYVVRLMRTTTRSDGLIDMVAGADSTDSLLTFDSEWNRFIYPLYRYVPEQQTMVNVENYTNADLGFSTNTGQFCWCQEAIEKNQSYHTVRGFASLEEVAVTFIDSYPSTQFNATFGWRPVLVHLPSYEVPAT